MAKKKKNDEVLPEGMTRRQAKLAARAAARAAAVKEPRPFKGLAAEADLVAMQEFAPSAHAPLAVKDSTNAVHVATILAEGVAAVVYPQEGTDAPQAFVAMQTNSMSNNPHRDLAYALDWARTARPGSVLTGIPAEAVAPGVELPALADLLEDPAAPLAITVEKDYMWLVSNEAANDPAVRQQVERASESIAPTERLDVDVPGAVWWSDLGSHAFIRWVRPEAEDALFRALARVMAAGELNLGEDTRFVGAFRTHGLAVPVFELDPTAAAIEFTDAVTELESRIAAALKVDEPLTAAERKALDTVRSRQVTLPR